MLRFAAAIVAASFAVTPALAEPVAYTVDKSHASITFTVEHLGYSTLHGRFTGYDADIVLDEENVANSKADVTIDMSSLETFWDQRDEHLKSADFFDVEKFPDATFKTTKFEQTGEDTVAVTGDFTLHGQTKTVTIDFVVRKNAANPMTQVPTIGLVGKTTLLRSDYGVDGYAPAVSDEIPLRIDLELNKAQ